MNNLIKIKGKIVFDPKDKTKKHANQSSWKKVAMVIIDGDITEYYSWFLERRYDIKLNRPLRGAHISFINDSVNDIMNGLSCNEKDAHESWVRLKKLYNNTKIELLLDVSPRSDGKHWWLNVPNEHRGVLHGIRSEVGLSRPYFGIHMSLGYANDKVIEHSKYILRLITKGYIE